MAAQRGNRYYARERRGRTPLERFLQFCQHEPETGCVVWTGGRTQGRGHNVPYGSFWFEGRRWFAHRWAAKYVHGLEIDELQVDHCCPHRGHPNTLCVEHLQAITAKANRDLQTRRNFIHLQVGLVAYEDMYGPMGDPEPSIPFFPPPAWLPTRGPDNGLPCPF